MNLSNWSFALAVFFMGCATYGTRLCGYWLLRNVTIGGRWKAAMDAVPPAILTAVIAPQLFLQGTAELVGGAVSLTAALLRLPLLAVIAVGVAVVAIIRQFS